MVVNLHVPMTAGLSAGQLVIQSLFWKQEKNIKDPKLHV
jgi:hypothetical protein